MLTTQTALAPLQQRAFKGVIHGWIFNGYSRLAAQFPYFSIPIGVGEY
jgi:ubiquinol-cytochrome c reductase subunit 8